MADYRFQVEKIEVFSGTMRIIANGEMQLSSPEVTKKIIMHFIASDGTDRMIPYPLAEVEIDENNRCTFVGHVNYDLRFVFFEENKLFDGAKMYFDIIVEDDEDIFSKKVDLSSAVIENTEGIYEIKILEDHLDILQIKPIPRYNKVKERYPWLRRKWPPVSKLMWASTKLDKIYQATLKKITPDPKLITFLSTRREELSGNPAFVYEHLKEHADIRIKTFCAKSDVTQMSAEEMKELARLVAESGVIVLDDYTSFIHRINVHPDTKIIQIWHACGAFKTFGFSRLGKSGGPKQKNPSHRNYTYATVSSKKVVSQYAEGFGISTDQVLPLGVPRTDVFFDPAYQEQTKSRLYAKYPMLKDKKVVLFAPTFRGKGAKSAHYPMEMFDVGMFMDALPEDYVLIIKHHPFIREKHPVPERCKDRVIDLSGMDELNDLLFITDYVITDYSSLVFEAS